MAQVNACGRADGASQLSNEFGVLPDAKGPQLLACRDKVGVHAGVGAEVLAPHLPHGIGIENSEGEIQAKIAVNEVRA